MADSSNLNQVARDAGFRERVAYYLVKKAQAVLAEATPDTNELALAKAIGWPQDTNPGGSEIVNVFSRFMVADSTTATALINNSFDHEAFDDASFETRVNAVWTTYAKSTA